VQSIVVYFPLCVEIRLIYHDAVALELIALAAWLLDTPRWFFGVGCRFFFSSVNLQRTDSLVASLWLFDPFFVDHILCSGISLSLAFSLFLVESP